MDARRQRIFYGLIVWFIVTLFVVYAFCLNTASAVFVPAVKASLVGSETAIALAVSAFIIGFALMQIPAGFLLDNYNLRIVVSGGVLALAIGNGLISFANNIFFFFIANLLQGIGASFAFIAVGIVISQWFATKTFPILFGLTQTFACISAGILHYVFKVLLRTYTWNQMYQGIAIFGAILFFLTIIFVKSPANLPSRSRIGFWKSLQLVFADPQIDLCAVAATASFGAFLAYAGYWYLTVQAFYSVEELEAVMISGMMFVGIGIGTPVLGWLSNRLKSRKIVLHTSLCIGAMLLIMCLYLPHYQIGTFIIIKIISLLTGFFLSGSLLYYTVVSELATDDTRGVALSVTNTGVFLFNTLLMFLPYVFVTAYSKMFYTNLWILPVSILMAILLNYFIRESYKE